jgi:hypothetical protein
MSSLRYWDLTEKRRAALTEEEVEVFIAHELMESGVLKPVPPTLVGEEEPTIGRRAYFVVTKPSRYGGEPDTLAGVAFETPEKAAAFLALSPLAICRDYDLPDRTEYAGSVAGLALGTIVLAEEAAVVAARDALRKAKASKDANDAERERWAKECRAADEASKGVWEDWHAARAKAALVERIGATLAEYTEMCGGDGMLAESFLAKAYGEEDLQIFHAWRSEE